MTPEWAYVRTADGIVHAFRKRQSGNLQWVAVCGAPLRLPDAARREGGTICVNETLDCMSCAVHEARR